MKKVYLRGFAFVLLASITGAFTSVCEASVESSSSGSTAVGSETATLPTVHGSSNWTVEAGAQAHSVAGQGSPWIGIAGAYRLAETYQIGIRGFVPASKTVDNSTYSIQAYGRIRVMKGQSTDLFVEPDYAANFYSFSPWPSVGLGIGALNHISPGLSVGVIGGIECAHFVVDSIGLEERSDLIIYPKVSLIADFTF